LIPYRELIEQVVNEVSPAPGMRILDAGCGTGNLEIELTGRCPGLSIHAVDFSAEMLARACTKVQGGRAWFTQADLDREIPLPDASVDVVVSVNCLYALPRVDFTLREFRRVLRPGGRLVIADPDATYSIKTIVKAHLRGVGGQGWRKTWRALREFVKRGPNWVAFGILNAYVYSRVQTIGHQLRASMEWDSLLRESGFGMIRGARAYAGQDNLIVAHRSVETAHGPCDALLPSANLEPVGAI
jgi:ubiquinone/menaquinone biosynthesis C-methylase UbiE